MNIHQLSRWRAKCLGDLEIISGWGASPNPDERKAYKIVRRRYEDAEMRYQRATSVLTTRELEDWGIRP